MSKIGKDMMTYGAVDLVGRMIGLITSPITTRLLSVPQYGAAPLIGAVWSPVSLLQYGGMDYAYPFLKSSGDHEDNHLLITTATVVSHIFNFAVWGIFVCVAFYHSWLANYAEVTPLELFLFVASLLPLGLIYWFLYLFRYMRNTKLFVRITLLSKILPAVVVLPMLAAFAQPDRLLISWGFGLIVQCLALAYALYLMRAENLWPYVKGKFSGDVARKMIRYGLFLAPAAMLYSLTTVTDRLLVGWFMGVEDVAILQLGLAIGGIGLMLSGWFGLAFDPHLIEWIGSKKIRDHMPKIQSIVNILAPTFFGMACGAAIWTDWVFYYLYPGAYMASAQIVPFLLLAGCFPVLSRIGIATILIANRPRLQTGVYIMGFFINLGVGLWAIPQFGLMGSVAGTILSEIMIFICWIVLGKFVFRNFSVSWIPSMVLAMAATLFLVLYESNNVGTAKSLIEASFATVLLAAVYFSYLRGILGRDGFMALLRSPLEVLR